MRKFSIFVLFISSFLLFTGLTHAQVTPGVSTSDISIALSPQFPGPNQSVSATIDSYAVDLNASTITWTVNGKQIAKGQGLKNITFTVGTLGSRTNVTVSIDNAAVSLQKSFTVSPNSVNIIWEAYTYTPPFFKGKALYTAGSAVKFTAIPSFSGAGSPANMVYTWTYNDTVLGDASGAGKNTITIPGQLIPRPLNVVVDISDPMSGASGEGSINLNSVNSLVLLYQNDPLYGVEYEHALGQNTPLTGAEIDLAAVPYYFSVPKAIDPNISYVWSANGQSINGSSPYQAFRRADGVTSGSSQVSVSVTDPNTLFQAAAANTMINFQNGNSSVNQVTF